MYVGSLIPTLKMIIYGICLPFRSLWICEEKELVHEIAGLGELKSPWHANQMAWLENHLNLINTYSQALENLDNCKGASNEISYQLSNVVLYSITKL